MYQPPHFREPDLAAMHALIRARPLGLLVSGGEGGLLANPVPFTLDETSGERGTLRTHLSRANGQWRALASAPGVLVVFQGVDGYVTPSWYETKRETGRVVPTWNYAIVQARGPARVIEDAAWLRTQVEALTAVHESPRATPWAVDDAPPDFVAAQLRGIVGIEIEIAAIEGKWKVSQNRPEADRRGVAEGFAAEAGDAEMTALVRSYGGLD